MLGGYQILDLRKIDLTITKTQSNITDAYVLSQLLKLRDFIDKDYDFSKPIENQLKPVLIRYRDKKNGEKSEGAMFGELAVVDNYYTFKITGRISGALILTIKVAFQEITNDYGAKEWAINTAKIQLQDVIEDLEGNLALEGDLDVSGDVDVGGDLTVTGSFNGEENPSVKPVYCHPISIYDVSNEDTSKRFFATCLIFNNSPTAFNGNTFLEFVRSLAQTANGRIMVSGGGFKSENGAIIFSSLFFDGSNEQFIFEGYRATVGDYSAASFEEWAESVVLIDGVNKIN